MRCASVEKRICGLRFALSITSSNFGDMSCAIGVAVMVPPEVLSRHGPPLLRRVRCQSFPGFIARMRPSDFLVLRRPKLWSSLAFGLTVLRALFLAIVARARL